MPKCWIYWRAQYSTEQKSFSYVNNFIKWQENEKKKTKTRKPVNIDLFMNISYETIALAFSRINSRNDFDESEMSPAKKRKINHVNKMCSQIVNYKHLTHITF